VRASLRWYSQRALAQLSEGAWLVGGMGADAHLWQSDHGYITVSCNDPSAEAGWTHKQCPLHSSSFWHIVMHYLQMLFCGESR